MPEHTLQYTSYMKEAIEENRAVTLMLSGSVSKSN